MMSIKWNKDYNIQTSTKKYGSTKGQRESSKCSVVFKRNSKGSRRFNQDWTGLIPDCIVYIDSIYDIENLFDKNKNHA